MVWIREKQSHLSSGEYSITLYLIKSRQMISLDTKDKNEFIRYLEVWIREKDHKKFTIDLLQREIAHITQALKYKKLTDKQALYILNRVLISRLEYRIQHCFLNENECRKLIAKYMKNFKNSINISRICPNSIILHK